MLNIYGNNSCYIPNIQTIRYVVHEDDTKNVNIANSTFVHDDGLGF